MRHNCKRWLLLTKMAENVGKTNYEYEELAFLACVFCKYDKKDLIVQASIFHAIEAIGTHISSG